MTVHLFGANSSPSCANYALRKTALDFGKHVGSEAAQAISRNFYVDDCLKSVESEEEAIDLVRDLRSLCEMGGFNLTKFVSNSVTVLQSVPHGYRAQRVKEINLGSDQLPAERALGVHWDVERDILGFNVDVQRVKENRTTRRGLLSTVAALYDPLGLASPFIIRSRMMLQELSRLKLGWDDDIPCEFQNAWQVWLRELQLLSTFSVPRCFKIISMKSEADLELHHFADASERGYGVATYVRQAERNGDTVTCSLLISKYHVTPLKAISIPRLELCAAALAVKTNLLVIRALDLPISQIYFWTDSTTVLKYIRNEKSRYQVFVANRLAVIHDGSSISQWNYVPSAENPADFISRGQRGEDFVKNEAWRNGPEFLSKKMDFWPSQMTNDSIPDNDLEVKMASVAAAIQHPIVTDPVDLLVKHYSTWRGLVRGVAWILRVKVELIRRAKNISAMPCSRLGLNDLQHAERVIIQYVQSTNFDQEIKDISSGSEVRLSSKISVLNPYIEEGLLRVGGRLKNSSLGHASKHPILLPSKTEVTAMIIRDVHERAGHEGRQHVLSDLRKQFWVVKANSEVRKVIAKCLDCRRRHRPPELQKMADLPEDRVQCSEPPFTTTGVDCFGPFYVKKGRSQTKKYGVIFTCLSVRAVHLEIADTLSTDSFICAMRRFMARRGQVRTMISDQGTNFVGANRELKKELKHLHDNQTDITEEMVKRGVDWKFNPPGASHFGGVWERLIRSVRKTLDALLEVQPLTEETLNTLMCEIEAIINNRPLTPVSADHRDLEPLTPNHILLLREGSCAQMGLFSRSDLLGRKRWKQAQYLADQFWRRWRKEYLPSLQPRPGHFTRARKNLKVGDVVLLVDGSVPRGHWPLGRITDVRVSEDGLVRSAKVKSRGSTLSRPVTKMVKIVDVDWLHE